MHRFLLVSARKAFNKGLTFVLETSLNKAVWLMPNITLKTPVTAGVSFCQRVGSV